MCDCCQIQNNFVVKYSLKCVMWYQSSGYCTLATEIGMFVCAPSTSMREHYKITILSHRHDNPSCGLVPYSFYCLLSLLPNSGYIVDHIGLQIMNTQRTCTIDLQCDTQVEPCDGHTVGLHFMHTLIHSCL